jgi:hypothetical protein
LPDGAHGAPLLVVHDEPEVACAPGAAARAAELGPGLEHRALELKGKQEVVDVVALTVGPVVNVG